MNRKNQIITVIGDRYHTDGSVYHRFLSPLKYLDAVFGIRYNPVTKLSEMPEEYVKNSKAIQFSNIISLPRKNEDGSFDFSNIYEIVSALKDDAGLALVLDIDDLGWELPTTHPNYNYFVSSGYQEAVKMSMQLADVVTTTNSTLANHIKSHNSNVEILPNVISKIDKQWTKFKTPTDKVRYGYLGGGSHNVDIHLLKDAGYEDIELMFPCNLDNEQGKDMYDTLSKYVNKVNNVPLRDVFSYGQLYKDIEVSFSILEDNEFNRAKSNLKWLEANASGTALLEIGLELDKEIPNEREVARSRYHLYKNL